MDNAATIEEGQRLAVWGPAAALSFASAKYPGGCFLGGARAQEESLARSSGLYACLKDCRMYAYHHARHDAMYSDYVIYSPEVPVFRNHDGDLLERPWCMSIITSPAANATALGEYVPARLAEVPAVMADRTAKVLAVAARHDHETLVLGAWGCGAFGIESAIMARVCHEALTGRFRGVFKNVVFAIADRSEKGRIIGPFRRLLPSS